ncbi:MAG: NAD-dependent epimerase/dehydratase family protein [Chloroflexota bacterium]|nr:NAD-dependent epimerase/dehydratase family protein [Chloroflexota bacterium]
MNDQRPHVLITGAGGLIGQALIRRLSSDFRLSATYRGDPPADTADVDWVQLDLTSESSVESALSELSERQGRELASVVHLAAYYDFSGQPSPLYDEVTVGGSGRLVRHLQRYEVEQFIFSSTMLVHRPQPPGEAIDESTPLGAKWDYPASKIETENLLRDQRGRIPVVLLRIAGVYNEDGNSIPLSRQLQRIYERQLESYVFPGDPAHGQAFVHLEDVVEAIRLTIDRRAELPPETELLIGEPETLSYEDLQQQLGELVHGREWPAIRVPAAMAKVGAWAQDVSPLSDPFIKPWMIDLADDHYDLDIGRAREMLGWQPTHSLRETLPRMVRRLLDDPQRFYAINDLGEPPPY